MQVQPSIKLEIKTDYCTEKREREACSDILWKAQLDMNTFQFSLNLKISFIVILRIFQRLHSLLYFESKRSRFVQLSVVCIFQHHSWSKLYGVCSSLSIDEEIHILATVLSRYNCLSKFAMD